MSSMPNIVLHIEPKQSPLSWAEFIATKPPYSIALDGYVYGSTKFITTDLGPYANFNHHEEVDRLSTRATCAQVLVAIRQGLTDAFIGKDGDITFNVYVNDCDQDVCLSWFILKNHWMCSNTINPAINRLVHMEDMMDTCSGAYPFPIDLPILQQIAWIFEPYTHFRMTGGIENKDVKDFEIVIFDVEQRILNYLLGKAGVSTMNMSYKRIGGGKIWSMVIETGFHARTAMMSAGIKAFVSVRHRDTNTYTYSIGKMSNYIPFDVLKLLETLNKAEGNEKDKWGGSNTIGGSPRVDGSKLPPSKVEEIINLTLENEKVEATG